MSYGSETMADTNGKLFNMRQIAELAGVSKMTVYRYIKSENITETSQDGKTLLFNDTTKSRIVGAFKSKDDITDDTEIKTAQIELYEQLIKSKDEQIGQLLKEIDIKNNQIEQLTKLMDQQQQLNLATQKQIGTTANKVKRHWWQSRVNDTD